MAKPLGGNKKNAIEVIAFVVHFNMPFSAQELSMFTKDSIDSDRYPAFNENIMHQFELNQQLAMQPAFIHSPVVKFPVWQKFSPSGKVEHELRFEPQSIVYVCTVYNGWEKTIAGVLDDFGSLCSNLEDKKIEKIALQITDKFLLDESEQVTDNLFMSSSCYLTERSKSAGKLWHVHQGWFDETHADFKLLNVLNLGSLELMGTDKIHVIIDHTCEVRFSEHKDIDHNMLKTNFNLAHDKNVLVLKGLLTTDMLANIGLIKDE
jgi:uncharacterized protein (TIGR04255 family)